MEILKNCPFCGSPARWRQLGQSGVGHVYCKRDEMGCGNMGGANKKAAIAAWNRRSEPKPEPCAECGGKGVIEIGDIEDNDFEPCKKCSTGAK